MTEDNNASVGKANTLLGLQFLSDFGDQITTALLALCVLDITRSTSKVGFIYIVTTFGFVVFTLAGGILGDALSRKNILCVADVGRAIAILLLIFAVKEKSIGLIYATSFLLSMLGALHGPVKGSMWAESVPMRDLEQYNSLSEFSVQASTILGPLIASFFVMKEWASIGFGIDAITFLICAIIFSRIISDKPKTKTPKRDFLKGFKIIARENGIKKYVAYDAIQMIGFGAFNATFLVLAQRDFGWSKADYAYHLSIVSVFTTVGALIGATRFAAKINPNMKLIVCALLSTLALYCVLKLQSFPHSSLMFGICDALMVLTMAVARTKVQLIAKQFHPDYLSSVIAARSILIKAATLFGAGACLLVDDFISLRSTLFIFIIPIGLSCLPFLSIRKRSPLVAATIPSASKKRVIV